MSPLVVLLLWAAVPSTIGHRICARTQRNSTLISNEDENFDLSGKETLESDGGLCKKGITACFAVWKTISLPDNLSTIQILAQGCWDPSGNDECLDTVCAPRSKSVRQPSFCCCTGDVCNSNISLTPLPYYTSEIQSPPTSPQMEANQNKRVILKLFFALVLGISSIMVLAACLLWKKPYLFNRNWRDKSIPGQSQSSLPPIQNAVNNYPPADFKLNRVVGQGRYGTVWLGSIRDEPVAVKIFPAHYSHYYFNEKDIYSLPFMEHPSLLTYFGCDESTKRDGLITNSLFLSYCPHGTLQDYLKGNTLDLGTMCKMASSASSGLAHLHTEIRKGDKWKPCVTHRDVNSKNILVKNDLTCCICDLGLSVKITGSHYYNLGEEQHAETKSINEVGTLRYMAPEVLEGAVNLRDCESSLKQIDVYALGLVLWELAYRTHDLYNKGAPDVPPYCLPFEKQVGIHPTLEQMQTAVCRNKARPLFTSEWKYSSSHGRLVKETIEDCTDQDGEARLTALCVHERFSQMLRSLASGTGVSPCFNSAPGFPSTIQTNYIGHNSTFLVENIPQYRPDKDLTSDGGGSEVVSEATYETTVTQSPSEPFIQGFSSQYCHNEYYLTLQPYQGRNPCMERNLLSGGDSSEECCIIQKSRKHNVKEEEKESLIASSKAEPQVQSRIPYVQNRPFCLPKECNSTLNEAKPLTSMITKPIKKLLRKNSKEGRVIVSPFQEAIDISEEGPKERKNRPASLQLSTMKPDNKITMRIKTPGDLPPSVRRKRGSQLRLSLYDDRMMSGLNSEEAEETQTVISLPVSSFNSPQL